MSSKARRPFIIGGLVLSMTVSACVALTPPDRPVYTGPDVVSSIDASQLVGSWVTRELNPFPGEDVQQESTIEYRDDGSLRGLLIPKTEGATVLGEMKFEITGNWQVDGDTLIHTNIEVNSTSDNAMGAMISQMMNSSARNIAGTANVYEATADRIVMVGEDGAAIEYRRQ